LYHEQQVFQHFLLLHIPSSFPAASEASPQAGIRLKRGISALPCPNSIDTSRNRDPTQWGGAFVLYKRFAVGKTSVQGEFISIKHVKIPMYP